jgi:TolA-binding protein
MLRGVVIAVLLVLSFQAQAQAPADTSDLDSIQRQLDEAKAAQAAAARKKAALAAANRKQHKADQPPPDAVAGADLGRTPEQALRQGNAALAGANYAAAAAAREVLAGNGVRGIDARVLLARAESGQHQYREAASDFFLAYKREPKGAAAPVALLGVANALVDMNDNGDACRALAKLDSEFPKMSASLQNAAAYTGQRASCH